MRLRNIFSVLIILVFMVTLGYSADQYNQTVKVYESPTHVVYYGTIIFTASNLEDNWYTQAMPILDLQGDAGFVWAVCSDVTGTEDVNILIQYSPDRTNWTTSSLNSGVIIDQVQTTMKGDTLSTYTGVRDTYFPGARWMRLNADGQASNVATTVSWYIVLKKTEAFEFKGFRKDAKGNYFNPLDKY